jgi:ABC-type multidrug transport system ATPase subunit
MPTSIPATFALDEREIRLGRDPDCDIVLKGVGISAYHARILLRRAGPVLIDAGSTYGTQVNSRPVLRRELHNGDLLTIGVFDLQAAVDDHFLHLTHAKRSDSPLPHLSELTIDPASMSLGRDSSNTIPLPHPLISRRHCTVVRMPDGGYALKDHGSTNGTYVNGRRVIQSALADGDIVQVGPYRYILDKGKFVQAEDYNRITLVASAISVMRGTARTINRISLSISAGEFVAILGPSGAGKTTLALALTGQIPVTDGEVFYNGLPLKKFVGAYASSIGYVSQYTLLRPELTVGETLTEQSILRLPADSQPVERMERVREVMEMLDISRLSNRRIAKLSGGEAKRVHIGVELLSSPTVIFLDEPLAGLDPGLVHRFMELFKDLARRGHTLLLTTHTLEQLDLCNRVVFVNCGHLVFNGAPGSITTHFKVSTLAEAYDTMRKDPQFSRSATDNSVESREVLPRGNESLIPASIGGRGQTVKPLFQFVMLLARYTKILIRDHRNLALIIVQAPLIAVILGIVFPRDATFLPLSFYFCLTISAIWIGGVNTVREFAREWPHFTREYRIGMSIPAYLIAKVVLFSILGCVQAALFGLIVAWFFPPCGQKLGQALILMAAASISGGILGLCISAFSRNTNQAVSWLPIIFIPQIFFSGILIPFDEMPLIGNIVSYCTVSRPIFALFKKVFLLEESLWSPDEWQGLLLLNSFLIILMLVTVTRRGVVSHPE